MVPNRLTVKFLGRALSGLILAGITLALVIAGVWRLQSAGSDAGARRSNPVQERTYNVAVATLAAQTVTPMMTAYGQISAWRMLEIRTPQAGPITEISPNLRSGASARAGELLFRIDDADFRRRVSDAGVALAQARAEFAEATDSLPLARSEVGHARRQLDLRRTDLKRKTGLKGKGFVAQGAVDEARIAVAAAEQTYNGKRMALIAAQSRLRARELAVERADIVLANAQKALDETVYTAPFAGALTDISANLGKRLATNEKLGVLIDPSSLEVSFSVTDEQFGRLLDTNGGLKPLEVTAVLSLGERDVSLSGTLDRAASVTNIASGGRQVFARLEPGQSAAIRPGDFVTVQVVEESIANVASVPVLAASDSGELLLLTEDDRLQSHQATIVRRQDQVLILRDVPFGREYVVARQPFLAPGVLVRPRRSGDKPTTAPTTIALSDERRNALRTFIEGRQRMPPDIRDRILKALERPEVPARMVERIEARMTQMSGAASTGAARPASQ